MYQVGHTDKRPKSKRRRLLFWSILLLSLAVLTGVLITIVRSKLKPTVTIIQTKPQVAKVVYATQTKHYAEPDFGIDLPATWQPVPRPDGPYQSYTWQSPDRGTNGQQIEVFEDTIPTNFAVNRVLIITGQTDHLQLSGTASDNCATFTRGLVPIPGQTGVPAKWQNVSFLCDQFNQERDVIGTSSADGIDTVLLKSPSTGSTHKFFFSYTDHAINPDYTIFYNALTSLHLQ